jgi:hypothetical protein
MIGNMKTKILNVLLILTSLIGYLEWPGNNHLFLFQAEVDIFSKLVTNPTEMMHPFIVMPIAGQALLLFTLFQQKPSKILTYTSISSLGILLAFMFVIGLISLNFKILVSSIPFLVIAIYTVIYYKKTSNKKSLQ